MRKFYEAPGGQAAEGDQHRINVFQRGVVSDSGQSGFDARQRVTLNGAAGNRCIPETLEGRIDYWMNRPKLPRFKLPSQQWPPSDDEMAPMSEIQELLEA
jgi:hypothetical protein